DFKNGDDFSYLIVIEFWRSLATISNQNVETQYPTISKLSGKKMYHIRHPEL
ncbi:10204_t:CDS:1, partial [Entrophospora sp. SA101]